ncbi:helix-turn-helix domain-containing protein [Actinomadura gamaensis]|uniref:Helix-turn-helix domain-containing protein n=1 Tax=Actinomadura gamaensis TaxID=1763541 RepID=A0ABV9U832_9ACTN
MSATWPVIQSVRGAWLALCRHPACKTQHLIGFSAELHEVERLAAAHMKDIQPPQPTRDALAEVLNRLTAARAAQGLSLRQLAARMPYRSSAVSAWETGARTPMLDALAAWSDALGYRLTLIPIGDNRP